MPRPREVRTFVHLQHRELVFLQALQRLIQRRAGLKRPPPMHKVIQGLVLDYCRVVETGANPDLLEAFIEAMTRQRRRRGATLSSTGVPRAGPTAWP